MQLKKSDGEPVKQLNPHIYAAGRAGTVKPRKPLSNLKALKVGDSEEFNFDGDHYTECQLLHDSVFHVRKWSIAPNGRWQDNPVHKPTFVYIAALQQDDLSSINPNEVIEENKHISSISCIEGQVMRVDTAGKYQTGIGLPAFRCGLSTLLCYLCMVDPDVKGDGIGFNFEQSPDKEVNQGFVRLDKFSTKHCLNVIHYSVDPDHILGIITSGYQLQHVLSGLWKAVVSVIKGTFSDLVTDI